MPSSADVDFNDIKPNKEICNYFSPWQIGALSWAESARQNQFTFAISSFKENTNNFISVVQLSPNHSSSKDQNVSDFSSVAEHSVKYPITKILWNPEADQSKLSNDLIASTGDFLRIWDFNQTDTFNHDYCKNGSLTPLFSLNTRPGFISPLTSMDWNRVDSRYIVTSSVDTTCTVWDIETQQTKTQLIAHDREVFDVKFVSNSTNMFYSCGADGSIRMFDLRSLEHSTILFEEQPRFTNTVKSSPNNNDYNSELATISLNNNSVSIIDVRFPGVVVAELIGHDSQISACEWSPNNKFQLTTSASDGKVLFWDINTEICNITKSSQTEQNSYPPQPSYQDIQNQQSYINASNQPQYHPENKQNNQLAMNYKNNLSNNNQNLNSQLISNSYSNGPGSLAPEPNQNYKTAALPSASLSNNDNNRSISTSTTDYAQSNPGSTIFDFSNNIQNYYDEIPLRASPLLNYVAKYPVNLLSWNYAKTDWVAISFGSTVQALRV
ncbi:DDB1- and CUL4-associated factor 7-like protein [Smittium culicis]|uniref:DDB1-and CUL4-associated factor 7-like protein n=1 Tax=Smittium culicis TaxID=133412 RepID=A0A1R1YFD3_9FUNG|nr:DDB1- and CUL4-associated factor 7-like protein [Smittium culicis]OMJ25627.1 DDB1- and CUL4-associated factor 7-like protein [Smittium culicis]